MRCLLVMSSSAQLELWGSRSDPGDYLAIVWEGRSDSVSVEAVLAVNTDFLGNLWALNLSWKSTLQLDVGEKRQTFSRGNMCSVKPGIVTQFGWREIVTMSGSSLCFSVTVIVTPAYRHSGNPPEMRGSFRNFIRVHLRPKLNNCPGRLTKNWTKEGNTLKRVNESAISVFYIKISSVSDNCLKKIKSIWRKICTTHAFCIMKFCSQIPVIVARRNAESSYAVSTQSPAFGQVATPLFCHNLCDSLTFFSIRDLISPWLYLPGSWIMSRSWALFSLRICWSGLMTSPRCLVPW